jgi:hypothetical protein
MMDGNRRDELDVLVERAVKNWVSGATPPDRVWNNIRLGLRERAERGQSTPNRLRQSWADAWSWGTEALVSARIILTPTVSGGDGGWTERMLLAGPPAASLRVFIHH